MTSLNEFPVARLKSQAPCWPQTPAVSGLSVGATSCTSIRAKLRCSGISLLRQPHSNLPWAVSTASHGRSQGACGQYMSFCFSFSVINANGSRADGGGGWMLKRVTDSMHFNSCHSQRRRWYIHYGSAKLQLPHKRRTEIFLFDTQFWMLSRRPSPLIASIPNSFAWPILVIALFTF